MAGFLEEYGKLKIEQIQIDGWVDGTYDTHITYCGKIFAINYHFHATEREKRKIDPATALYNLTNGLDIIDRCNLYKDLLGDVLKLEYKIKVKIENGLKYNFDVEFVHSCLKKIVNTVHDDIQDIYLNLKFEAMSEGRQFYIPLPDYTVQYETEDTENEQCTDVAIEDNPENELLVKINRDIEVIIGIIKELKLEKRPAFATKLVDEVYLCKNGSTPSYSLNQTVARLFDIINPDDNTDRSLSWQFIQDTFTSPTGEKYSESACKAARDYANTHKTLKAH
jgi:hypothetical protein